MKFDPKERLWEQKYRPTTLADCVLAPSMREIFKGMIDNNDMSNLLLSSTSPGTGKTTVARALLHDLGYDVLFLNASSDRGINMVKFELPKYCSSVSFSGNPKAVILDEADSLTKDAQKALRALIEQYSKNVRFIMTCNYASKIIQPIVSRLHHIEFVHNKGDKLDVMKQMIIRMSNVCKSEQIPVSSPAVLKELVLRNYPDNRKIMVTLQNYARTGKIDEGILTAVTANDDMEPMIDALKNKDFKSIREMIPNYAGDAAGFMGSLYKAGFARCDKSTMSTFIELIGELNRNLVTCIDTEIELTYTLTQMMLSVKWR